MYKIFTTILILTGIVFGGGFQINEHGARAMGMAGAFTGLANDPSAIYYNPAGLSILNGTQISAGLTLIKPAATFRGPSPSVTEYEVKESYFTPPNFYVTHKLNNDIGLGFGMNTPYGLGTEWDENWVGRYLAVDTEIRTFFFYFSAGYKINDILMIGVGLNYVYGDVKINRKNSLAPFSGDADITLEGDGTGIGFNLGILLKPVENFSIGIAYRSKVDIEFEGTAETVAPEELAPILPSGNISAPLTTPDNITLGLAFSLTKCLTLTTDFQYIGWSTYDKLEVTFNDVIDENGEKLVSSDTRDYENTFILRGGFEYLVMENLHLRGGLLYDNNPVQDKYVEPTLPDSDRIGFNLGFGYQLTECLKFDMSYLFLRFSERTITDSEISYSNGDAPFTGVYNSTAHLIGANFSYNL